jgi:hypothetical protein
MRRRLRRAALTLRQLAYDFRVSAVADVLRDAAKGERKSPREEASE